MLTSLLEQHGIKYEDLNALEKETLQKWQQLLNTNELTLPAVKDFVAKLIEAVEREITDLKESTSFWTWIAAWKKDFYLKARLKNYLMIQDFLTGPDRARKHIEQSISNIKP